MFLANWGPPERLARAGGPVDRRICRVLKEAFWNAWKLDKPGLKAEGVQVFPDAKPGTYYATWEVRAGTPVGPAPARKESLPLPQLEPVLEAKLLPWQPDVARKLAASIVHHGSVLDASGTGVGKTTACIAAMKTAGLKGLLVCCPLNVIPAWEDWGAKLGLMVRAINYEKLVRGVDGVIERKPRGVHWLLPDRWGIAFDEAHRVGGLDTLNARLGRSAFDQRVPTAYLSATIADSPLRLSTLGEALGLFRRSEYWDWAIDHGCSHGRFGWSFGGSAHAMAEIRGQIFDRGKGVRLTPSEIPGFPECDIQPLVLNVGTKTNEIQRRYQEIEILADRLRQKGADRKLLRQEIIDQWKAVEMAKLPSMIESLLDAEEEGSSVILFTRFRQTALQAHAILKGGLIIGGQTNDERQGFIRAFQSDKLTRLAATVDCGGEAISLHDITGRHPRYVEICPPWSSGKFRQAVGRGWRAGAMTRTIVRLCLAHGTDEMDLAGRLHGKLNSLDALTDSDFTPGKAPDTRALLAAIEEGEA